MSETRQRQTRISGEALPPNRLDGDILHRWQTLILESLCGRLRDEGVLPPEEEAP